MTVVAASERPPPAIHVTEARGTGSFLATLTTRTGRKPSVTATAISRPPIGTATCRTYIELAKCTATSAGPGGNVVSVTRPSASVVPRHLVLSSGSSINDGAPRPVARIGVAWAGLSGPADTMSPFTGPV